MNYSERQTYKRNSRYNYFTQIFNKTTKINKRELSPNRIIRPGSNKKKNNTNVKHINKHKQITFQLKS